MGRLYTDACPTRPVGASETEVESLEKYAAMSRKSMAIKEFLDAMKGYHDLVDHGRREIYSIET